MSTTTLTYTQLLDFHKSIANAHVDINDFYRVDFDELQGQMRAGINGFPVLFMEAPSIAISSETKGVTNFGNRANSILILDNVYDREDFPAVEAALEKTHRIALDIISYLLKCSKDSNHFLFGKFDSNTVSIEKVGPIVDNLYGWNILYQTKSFESMQFNPDKWNF